MKNSDLNIDREDTDIADLIKAEEKRQREGLTLIASENYPSRAVLDALGSILSAKYAEGYPGKRYYGGNQNIDKIENMAIHRAKQVFGADRANVQPYSGSPANIAVYLGLLALGDTLLGMRLSAGGHLTHGHKVSFSGRGFNATSYGVDPKTGLIDYDEVKKIAQEVKPKILVSGATAYPRKIEFDAMQSIAQSVGAAHLADISHIAGLVVAGVHESPLPFTDVVMTTTHKTLRGPRGAIIMAQQPDLAEKIDRAVFPGLQGGPHENNIAGIAVALKEAFAKDFGSYIRQVVDNAKVLAEHLMEDHGFDLVTGGTDNHLILIDLSNKGITGREAEEILGGAGITVNKNTIPGERRSPLDPSGIRIGTPAITSRGATATDMVKIARWIARALGSGKSSAKINKIRAEVRDFASELKLPGVTE